MLPVCRFLFKIFGSLNHKPLGLLCISGPQCFKLLAVDFVVRGKKEYNLLHLGVIQRHRYKISGCFLVNRYGQDAIVPNHFLFSVCSASMTASRRVLTRQPQTIGAWSKSKMSRGSPSAARVPGTNPKLNGKTIPCGRVRFA